MELQAVEDESADSAETFVADGTLEVLLALVLLQGHLVLKSTVAVPYVRGKNEGEWQQESHHHYHQESAPLPVAIRTNSKVGSTSPSSSCAPSVNVYTTG